MPDVRTGYGCPLCEAESGAINEIIARDGRGFVCSKVEGHAWADPSQLQDLNPKIRFQQEQAKAAPQQNHTSINVSIPVGVYNALLDRLGDKLGATAAAMLNILAEGEPMVLSVTDVQRLKMMMPEQPKSGSHLIGMIFAMQQDVQEAKGIAEAAAETTKAYEGMNPGKVVVDLGANFKYAADRAKNDGLPLKMWLDARVKEMCDNAWI